MSKKKKFKNTWANQTELGKRFGLSAIAVGKILIEHGLKNSGTKEASKKALTEGYARSTPLKNGTHHYMWNIARIQAILMEEHTPLSQIDYWVKEVKSIFKEAERLAENGEDKLASIAWDFAYEEVPQEIRKEVKQKVEEDDRYKA